MAYQPILDLTIRLLTDESTEKLKDSLFLRSVFIRKMMLTSFCLEEDGRICVTVRGTKKQLLSWINGFLDRDEQNLDDDESTWASFKGELKLVA